MSEDLRSVDTVPADVAEARRHADLEDYRRAWERTSNPFYVWEALDYCRANMPLPPWVFAYLQSSRAELKRLAFPMGADPRFNGTEATDRIPEAMGLRRAPNWNAIERRRQDNAAADVALAATLERATGRKPHEIAGAVAKAMRRTAKHIRKLRRDAHDLWRR
ncbi:MAG: hypothetical protein WAS21_20510 [Geminicoccaceae bacterium]